MLTLLVLAAGTIFVWSLLKTDPQTASTELSSSQGSVESKADIKVESSEISEDIPKRDPKLPDYSNKFKYTEKLIKDSALSDKLSSEYAVLYDTANDIILYKRMLMLSVILQAQQNFLLLLLQIKFLIMMKL